MVRLLLYLVFVISIFGCSQQLKTLIALSGEKAEQASYVESQNKRFYMLIDDIKQGRLKQELTTHQVVKLYGEPIAIKDVDKKKIFVYRDTVDFFSQDKAYLYFNEDGKLQDFSIQSTEGSPTQD